SVNEVVEGEDGCFRSFSDDDGKSIVEFLDSNTLFKRCRFLLRRKRKEEENEQQNREETTFHQTSTTVGRMNMPEGIDVTWGRGRLSTRLTNQRDQAVSHAVPVVRVAWQVVVQEIFFVEKSPDNHKRERNDRQQPPKRAKRERNAGHHDEARAVHRVPDEPIKACGYNFLTRAHFDDGRGKSVLSKCQKYEE